MSVASTLRTQPPRGWYPDPVGSSQLRFWNGESWTMELAYSGPDIQPQYRYAAGGSIVQVHPYS